MTVSSTTNRKTFAGDDATTSFGTSPVVFFDNTDIGVYVVDDATGVATTLTENTHYTLTGGSGSTGTIDTSGGSSPHGALLTGTTLVIVRTLPLTQAVDLVNNDINDAEVMETSLDKLTMILQQHDEEIGRALKVPSSEGEQTDIAVAGKGGYYLRRNAGGTAFELAVGSVSTSTFTQSGAGAVERSITSKLGEYLSVKDFGAVGDGSTNDVANIQAACTAGAGRIIYFPYTAGGYKILSNITIPANTSWLFEKGAFIDARSAVTGSPALIYAAGSGMSGSLGGGLNATVNKGSRSIVFVNSSHGLVAGDLIALHNTTDGSWHPSRVYYRQGEFCEVKSVSGATVTLVSEVLDTYAATCVVYKVGTTTMFMKNVKVLGNTGDTANLPCIKIEYGRGIYLEDVEVAESTSSGIEVINSFNVRATLIKTRKSTNDAGAVQSSGFSFDSCQNALCDESILNSDRHGASISGGGYVVSRFCYITHSQIASRNSMALDLGHGHQEFCGVTFSRVNGPVTLGGQNCEVSDCVVQQRGTENMVTLSEMRSAAFTLARNKFLKYGANYVVEGTTAAFGAFTSDLQEGGVFRFIDNEIHDYSSSDSTYLSLIQSGSTHDHSFEISGNKQYRLGAGTIATSLLSLTYSSGNDWKDLVINNNRMEDGGIGIAQRWTNLDMRGNVCRIPNNNVTALQFAGKNGTALFHDNDIDYGNGGNSIVGTAGATLTRMSCKGNTMMNGARGSAGLVFTVAFCNECDLANNKIGNTADANITNPITISGGGLALNVSIDGDIYLGGVPDISSDGFLPSNFTFEKKITCNPAATSFAIWTIPAGMSFMPDTVAARADTDVTATNGEYYAVGVDAANRRIDYGVSTNAAAAAKHAKNDMLRWVSDPSKASQMADAGEVVALISTLTAADNAGLGNNMGAAAQTITVRMTGRAVGQLPSL